MQRIPLENKNQPAIEFKEYKNPALLESLNLSNPIWLSHNLMAINPFQKPYQLYDIKENKECKQLSEQESLFDNVKYLFKEDEAKEIVNNVKIAGRLINQTFYLSHYLFNVSEHQFATVDLYSIKFWDATNPNKIVLAKSNRVIPQNVTSELNSTSTTTGMGGAPWYFQCALFPNQNWVATLVQRQNFYFTCCDNNDSFSLKTDKLYSSMSILWNNQILLESHFHQYALLHINLEKKSTSILELNCLSEIKENKRIYSLAPGFIIACTSDKQFQCYDILSKDKRVPNDLKGIATVHNQLSTGEFIFWDASTKQLNILDPRLRCIRTLLELDEVSKILCMGAKILIVTPNQLLYANLPNKLEVSEHLKEMITHRGLQKIIIDYLGLNVADRSLLSQHSFLCANKPDAAASEELVVSASHSR